MEQNYRNSNDRQQKMRSFKMNINQDDLTVGEQYRRQEGLEDVSLNSYSDSDAKSKMEKNLRSYQRELKKEQKRQDKIVDKQNTRLFRIVWWVSVALVGIMLAIFLMVGVNDMLAVGRTEENTVKVKLPANPTAQKVSEVLQRKGVINEAGFFELYATLTKSSDDFTQGTYEIQTNMDYEAIINYLQSMANRTDTVTVTIPEGQSVTQIAKTLKKAKVLSDTDKFLELCNSDYFDEDYDFLSAIDNDDERYYKLEGYLFPDTYECYVNEKPELTITRMLNVYEMRMYRDQDVEGWSKTINIKDILKEKKMDLGEVMTIASIIQAEAANADDMYYISSIIHNRLKADVDLGVSKLDMDSTFYYPYHNAKEVPEDMKDSFKSRYNTYELIGLPPGPICNPGMEAILAAIYPNDTSYLYFCHSKDGKPYYATNINDHMYNLSLNGYL